jgi:hypothetical protein
LRAVQRSDWRDAVDEPLHNSCTSGTASQRPAAIAEPRSPGDQRKWRRFDTIPERSSAESAKRRRNHAAEGWPMRPSLVRALRTVRHCIPVVICGIQSDAKPTAEIASPTAREGQIGQGKYFSNRIAPAMSVMTTMFMVPIMTSTSISPQQQPMQYAAWRRPACRSRSLPRRPVR